ncbi:MAG: hydroxypyruvate isomerase [Burkholderiales bacterium]|nr:hydroxypyruvate isomerase [Burkholderiales bacterium]
MPRFAANLSFLFNEVPFERRFARAAAAGFTGVEYFFPYALPAARIAALLEEHGLAQVLFNLPAGDWEGGERGIATHPGRMSEFRDSVGLALEYAVALGCSQVNCLAGMPPAGAAPGKVRETFVENLRYAADQASAVGVRMLSEPINDRDMPGFYLNRSAQAIALFDEAGSDNLYLQYDVYHMQVMEGDLAPTIQRLLPRIAHMQFADTPGRHQPGTGEINFPFLFGHVDRIGYAGWMSAEYKPLGGTEASLGWLPTGPAAGRA